MSEDFFYPWIGSDFFGCLPVVRFFFLVLFWRVKRSSHNLDANYAYLKMHKLAEKPACYSVTINKFIRAWDFPRNLQVTILLILSRFWKPVGSSLCPWMWQTLSMLSSEKADRQCSWGTGRWVLFRSSRPTEDSREGYLPSFLTVETVSGFCWRLFAGRRVKTLYTSLCRAVGILDDRRETTYDCIVCVNLKTIHNLEVESYVLFNGNF